MAIHVVFVCLGNICRSPAARVIFDQRVAAAGLSDQLTSDACGTAAFNVGKPADPRATQAAAAAGYDLSAEVARQIDDSDYQQAHYLLAMDRKNLMQVECWATDQSAAEIRLLMEFAGAAKQAQLDDPYYGDASQFQRMISELESAVDGLLTFLIQRHALGNNN
ncbi:low molecular weight phosphotyrosine protein phosphatase [Spongiibacter nanhainus]|uniref:protein-tyrosine-phosphatase n=1 Tax=Spongiibacter nanhainus TaxID=2794344 RepID=A0A7T4URW0_9GAMM|nr:low molecular weight protein-tyrosine-phosphatase [Spongiibacter nanhainus]QQD19912.1 low molecular weight phosphotyrosine protein phosphatase [Spongiibacter nanhainus]